ncbi:hypothetical protein [Stigmatella aurantiaca]|uniref:hypothetical protein n=1 Tax=Stigmatella aurantiaca TaxID=41 RepID=UPI003B285138
MRGVALKVIQELMGHSTIEVTCGMRTCPPRPGRAQCRNLTGPSPQPRAVMGW